MEIIIPEQGVCGVESIIFKENSSINTNPNMFEFFVDEEEFNVLDQDISTYRYFEVDSLSDQYRFGSKTSFVDNGSKYVADITQPYTYEDYTEGDSGNTRTMRYFHGKWKPISQKFITEYINSILVTDNFEIGFIKLGENNKLPRAINLGKLVNFSQDFHKDDITEDLIQELNYKMNCGKLNFNEKTKYMYYSEWFCSRISVTGKLKTLVLKEFIKSYKYLLDYHTSRQLTVDASTIDKIIESILNYKKGDSTDWKDGSLANFASNMKNILTGTTVYGEVNKDEIKKLILEEYDK
jgi:hypothetical protein